MGERKSNNILLKWISLIIVFLGLFGGFVARSALLTARVNANESGITKNTANIRQILDKQPIRDFLLGAIAKKLNIDVPKAFR